jgi:hypothetical protein
MQKFFVPDMYVTVEFLGLWYKSMVPVEHTTKVAFQTQLNLS